MPQNRFTCKGDVCEGGVLNLPARRAESSATVRDAGRPAQISPTCCAASRGAGWERIGHRVASSWQLVYQVKKTRAGVRRPTSLSAGGRSPHVSLPQQTMGARILGQSEISTVSQRIQRGGTIWDGTDFQIFRFLLPRVIFEAAGVPTRARPHWRAP